MRQMIRNSVAIHFLLSPNQMLRIQLQLIQFLVRIFLDKINRSFYPLRGKNLRYESIIAQGMTGGHFKEYFVQNDRRTYEKSKNHANNCFNCSAPKYRWMYREVER